VRCRDAQKHVRRGHCPTRKASLSLARALASFGHPHVEDVHDLIDLEVTRFNNFSKVCSASQAGSYLRKNHPLISEVSGIWLVGLKVTCK